MLGIYILKLEVTDEAETIRALEQCLPAKSLARFGNHLNVRSRLHSLAGEALVRYAINSLIPGHPTPAWRVSKHGKPYFSPNRGIHFNLSHSGQYIVCALCNKPVGIDVERKRKADLRIAERYFTPTERHWILGAVGDEQNQRFITMWTIKEAYLKCTGRGLTQSLGSFSVNCFDNGFLLEGSSKARRHFVSAMEIENGYTVAICSEISTQFTPKLVDLADVIRSLQKQAG